MKIPSALFLMIGCLLALWSAAQPARTKIFTRADTLRGSITRERAWWDVLRYDLTIAPDYIRRSTTGKNIIRYRVLQEKHPDFLQIDLKDSLHIDSIWLDQTTKLSFTREGNAWHVKA